MHFMANISGVGEDSGALATTNIASRLCTAITMVDGARCVHIGTCIHDFVTGVHGGCGLLVTGGWDVISTVNALSSAGMASAGMWCEDTSGFTVRTTSGCTRRRNVSYAVRCNVWYFGCSSTKRSVGLQKSSVAGSRAMPSTESCASGWGSCVGESP